MKKAVYISCTNHYNERAVFFEKYFSKNGYSCTYITSDFNHNTKSHYTLNQENTIQIPTKSYAKNLSFSRIYSHIKFARDTMKKVENINPDLVYIEIPPNSLCRQAAKLKKKKPEIKLIFDVFDMWPETFPNSKMKLLLKIPFGIWGWLRNHNIAFADVVLSECELFANKIKSYLKEQKVNVLYLCRKRSTEIPPACNFSDDNLHLCYLGSINNIIDIPTITNLIGEINAKRQVVLHIIGDGESRESFISSVKSVGAQVIYHGAIYDADQKQEIFNVCHFGLNIMKESVFVGLTMKSVDYFSGGLPIINSIVGDTWEIVQKQNIGVNIDRSNISETANKICCLSCDEIGKLKSNTYNAYNEYFTEEAFNNKLHSIFLD